jgi:protein-disulfide isomerase
MASRAKQKEEARARRLAEERAAAERARRSRRLQLLGGVVLIAVVLVGAAIAISSSGGSSAPPVNSAAAKKTADQVNAQLTGIPQSGMTIGSSSAPVTVTEFGDLECPICKAFAVGAESTLIAKDVKAGKVKLVYRSLETATGNGPDPGVFPTQQAAALAAGKQNLGWNYILMFYNLQGQEDTAYVTPAYLEKLALLIPSLNYKQWQTDRTSSALSAQVAADQAAANAKGFDSTPTIVVSGPKGQAQPIVGDTDYGTLESAIKSVQ